MGDHFFALGGTVEVTLLRCPQPACALQENGGLDSGTFGMGRRRENGVHYHVVVWFRLTEGRSVITVIEKESLNQCN